MAGGKLVALKLKSLAKPGRYGDGGGLWLQVRDSEHRSWLFRYTASGRPRQMGLGPYPDVSLADARNAAAECRAAVRKGADPIGDRKAAKAAARAAPPPKTFDHAAEQYLSAHESAWRNAKHRYQWKATLKIAGKSFGNSELGAIDTDAVMRVLEPIWHKKTETAARLRGRIESVLDYGAVRGWRSGENPARWRGHLAKLLPSPTAIAKVQHLAALPWAELEPFMTELRDESGVAARALEFTILCVARTGETIGATWAEVDLKDQVWTIRADRMKGGREHRVPLSTPAMIVIRSMFQTRTKNADFIFPSNRPDKPLSNMAMIMLLRRMKRTDLTAHGFRSTFRDWAGETTGHSREVVEGALAHRIGNKVEQAYARGDLFMKRRKLMEDWAAYCCSGPVEVTVNMSDEPPLAAA